MGRIRNTIELAKTSWTVLKQDRELLWFPVLSFLVSLVVILVIGGLSLAMLDTADSATGEETVNPAVFVLGLIGALALSIVAVFFNGALVAGAHERMTGGDPTVGSAVGHAVTRLPGLVPWALLTATIGLILHAIRQRVPAVGQVVVGLIGAAWEVATFLVVPAIVIDDMGAIDGLKRSGSLLRQTWGENLAARVGFGLLYLVAIVPAAILVGLAFASGLFAFVVVAIVAAVAWVALVMVVLTALSAVFQTALYVYATTGSVPSGFESSPLPRAFEQG